MNDRHLNLIATVLAMLIVIPMLIWMLPAGYGTAVGIAEFAILAKLARMDVE